MRMICLPPAPRFRKSLLILLYCGVWGIPATSAAQSIISAVSFPTAVADGGGTGATGTPYAVFVRIQGWISAASGQVYLKIYNGTNNEYMWSSAGAWSNATAYATGNQPVATLDGSGNWAGWIYAKHNSAVGPNVAVRAARVGATGTNLTTSSIALTVLSLSAGGNGGWIVRQNSPAVNKPVLAYAGGNVVGSYRAEDNGIAEGYAVGAGGFRIAVPAGVVDSVVALNEDGSRFTSFAGPWPITAGAETDASIGGGAVGKGTASILPRSLQGNIPQQMTIRLAGDGSSSIGALRIVLPPAFTWARSAGVVLATAPGSPIVAVQTDSITVSGLALGATDTARVDIINVTPRDTTATISIAVSSGVTADSLRPLPTPPSVFVYGTPVAIAVVKEGDPNGVPLRINSLITIRGVVTVANEFGGPSYLQDVSGGMAVFGSGFSTAVSVGDEVLVSGTLQPFNGLTEIVSPVLDRIISRGNNVEPLTVTASQVRNDGKGGVEVYEGRLVRLNGVAVAGSGGAWAGNTNYLIFDATDSTQTRISNKTNLVGTPLPASSFDMIGVVGQFISTAPYIGGYQVMPRSTADIVTSGPIVATVPVEVSITPTSLAIQWRTVGNGSTGVWYGKTPQLELGTVSVTEQVTDHQVTLAGLEPATIYFLRAFSAAGPDTSTAPLLIACTASPPQATGAINVYFNHSVNTSLAWYGPAAASQPLPALLIARITAARRSIDAALYSLSSTPGSEIANALIAARARGVHVRVMCEADNRNTPAFTALGVAGIPLISDDFDLNNAGAGLMHNKFFVFDARGGAPESVWVWTGSWNPTFNGSFLDFQNAVEIQDPALARAYTAEFNEMWGGTEDVPVQAQAKFGARKTDNTPHRFIIGGRRVECYFSPTDRVTSRIAAVLDSAKHSAAFALLTFTRSDLRASLVNQRALGRKVRGVMDNNTDTGTQYAALLAGGVDVRLKTPSDSLLHHKYAIVDGEDPSWNPTVVTGSHNWSNAAEGSNNENTLIIHDGHVANLFLQEFAARYVQFGGTDPILVAVDDPAPAAPEAFILEQNYPNPFNPSTTIRYALPSAGFVRLTVFDVLGRAVETLVSGVQGRGWHQNVVSGAHLASGVYFCRLEVGGKTFQRKMAVVK